VRWLFPGREVRIDTRDLATAEPIVLRFRDEEILEVSPETVVGHICIPMQKWAEEEPPYN
jgi:hypothetical protein